MNKNTLFFVFCFVSLFISGCTSSDEWCNLMWILDMSKNANHRYRYCIYVSIIMLACRVLYFEQQQLAVLLYNYKGYPVYIIYQNISY